MTSQVCKEKGYRYFEIKNSKDSSTIHATPIKSDIIVNTNSSTFGAYNGCQNNRHRSDNFNSNGNIDSHASTVIVSGGNIIVKPGISLIANMLKNKTNNSMDADVILGNYKNITKKVAKKTLTYFFR